MGHLITVYRNHWGKTYAALYPEEREEPLIVAKVPKEVVMRALQYFKIKYEDHNDHVIFDANDQLFKRILIFLPIAECHSQSEYDISALLARIDALSPMDVEFWAEKLVNAYDASRRKIVKVIKAFLNVYF
jgi:hypothetical protein